jgi:hypothetical protein
MLMAAGKVKNGRYSEGSSGFRNGADISLYRGASTPLNVSRVCPQDGQTKLFASRGAEWNSVRS